MQNAYRKYSWGKTLCRKYSRCKTTLQGMFMMQNILQGMRMMQTTLQGMFMMQNTLQGLCMMQNTLHREKRHKRKKAVTGALGTQYISKISKYKPSPHPFSDRTKLLVPAHFVSNRPTSKCWLRATHTMCQTPESSCEQYCTTPQLSLAVASLFLSWHAYNKISRFYQD